MFLEILLFVILGILAGTFTGLAPGIHVNNISVIVIGLSPVFLAYHIPPHAVVSFIMSMAVTHTILDFIPSIFLGVPEDSTALSVLPGHRLLLQGKGLEALFLTIIGGVGVTILFVLSTPILLLILPFFYNAIKPNIHWVLIAIVFIMIVTEEKSIRNPENFRASVFHRKIGSKRIWALIVFTLSGILGLIVFNSTTLSPVFLFLPLFTGLFGIPNMIISLRGRGVIPPQEQWIGRIDRNLIFSGIIKSFFSGLLVGTLPGVGAAQATVLTQEMTRKHDPKEFLISVGGINTAVAIFSILSLYVLERPRSGAAVAIGKLIGNFGINELILLISTVLIAVGISAILALKISKKGAGLIEKIPYDKLSLMTIAFLVILTAILTEYLGLLILFVSTAIGLIAPLTGIKRSHCMAVILLPVILFYAGYR